MVSKILILATCVFAFVVSSSEAKLRTGRAGSFRRLSFKDHDGQGRKNTWDGWRNVPLDEDENVGRNGGFKRKMSLLARSSAILPANLEPPAAKLTLVPLTPMVLNPRAQIAWAMTVAVGAARILVDAWPTTVGDAVAAEQSTGYICLSLVLI